MEEYDNNGEVDNSILHNMYTMGPQECIAGLFKDTNL